MKKVTVFDALRLPTFRNAKMISGHGGLQNEIKQISILDSPPSDVVVPCQGGAFYISSMYQTRGKEKNILDFLRYIEQRRASGICVMDEYISQFSDSVKEFCDEKKIPLISIDKTIPYADIISCIMELILTRQQKELVQDKIDRLIDGKLTEQGKLETIREVNPHFKGSLIVLYCLSKKEENGGQPELRLKEEDQLIQTVNANIVDMAFTYKKGIIVLLTFGGMSGNQPEERIAYVLDLIHTYLPDSRVGISNSCTLSQCGRAVVQALTAAAAELSSGDSPIYYSSLGIYRLLSALNGHPELECFYHDMFDPIWAYDQQNNSSLFDTLVMFFEKSQDFKKTADALFVHENTIRYRMSKVKEITASGISEIDFYENISIALKIHRLQSK